MSSLKKYDGKPIWVSRDPGTMMLYLWKNEPIYRDEYRRFCPSVENSCLGARHVTAFMEHTGLNVEPCQSMRIILSATVLKEVDWTNANHADLDRAEEAV